MLELTKDVEKTLKGVSGISKLLTAAPGWGRGKKKLRLKENGQPNHMMIEVADPEGKQVIHIYTEKPENMDAVREHMRRFAHKSNIPLLT